jgi:hypothetical protein
VNRFFFTPEKVSAIKRVEFVSDRMSYIVLRGRCYIIVLNVHAPTEESDDSKDSFYEELEQVFDRRWHSSILLCLIFQGS